MEGGRGDYSGLESIYCYSQDDPDSSSMIFRYVIHQKDQIVHLHTLFKLFLLNLVVKGYSLLKKQLVVMTYQHKLDCLILSGYLSLKFFVSAVLAFFEEVLINLLENQKTYTLYKQHACFEHNLIRNYSYNHMWKQQIIRIIVIISCWYCSLF